MVKCAKCGEEYSKDDLKELREMKEEYYLDGGVFLCPDCWDSFIQLDFDEKFSEAIGFIEAI